MVYFMIAYGIIWLIMLGYTAVLHAQQNRLERQITILQEILESNH